MNVFADYMQILITIAINCLFNWEFLPEIEQI